MSSVEMYRQALPDLPAKAGQAILRDTIATDGAAVDEVEQLVREYSRFVYRVAYSVVRNHHDAEDAAQETFLRVLRHQHELAEVRDRRLWLARIAWRVAVDRVRREPRPKNDRPNLLSEWSASGRGAERSLIERETVALLEKMIANLPPRLRDVVTLSTVEEMAASDIAAVLAIPEGSVRNRLFRARQLLREKLAAAFGQGRSGRRQE